MKRFMSKMKTTRKKMRAKAVSKVPRFFRMLDSMGAWGSKSKETNFSISLS